MRLEEGFFYDHGPNTSPSVLCPDCARDTTLWNTAADQLEVLRISVVRAWARHWGPVQSKKVMS